jgi:hypothetical protein
MLHVQNLLSLLLVFKGFFTPSLAKNTYDFVPLIPVRHSRICIALDPVWFFEKHLASGSVRIGTDARSRIAIPALCCYWFRSNILLTVPVGKVFFTPRFRIRTHWHWCQIMNRDTGAVPIPFRSDIFLTVPVGKVFLHLASRFARNWHWCQVMNRDTGTIPIPIPFRSDIC